MKKIHIILFIVISLKIFSAENYVENINKAIEVIKENKEFSVKNSIVSKIVNGELKIVSPEIECSSAEDTRLKKYYQKNIKKLMGYNKWDDNTYIIYPTSGYKIFEFKFNNKDKIETERFCYAEEYFEEKINLKENSLLKSMKNNVQLIIRGGNNSTNYKEDNYKLGIFTTKNDYYVLIFKDGRTEEGFSLYKYLKKEKEFKLMEESYKDKKIEDVIKCYLKTGEFFEKESEDGSTKIKLDLNNDKKIENIEIISKGEKGIISLKINGKNIITDEMGRDYYGFLSYKNKILLCLGVSDDGLEPRYSVYKYKNGKLEKEFEEEIIMIEGIRDGKILTWWKQLFSNGNDFEHREYIKYYDINKKRWENNSSLIGKWLYNDYTDLLIYKKRERAYNQSELLACADLTAKEIERELINDKSECNGVLKYKEKFKIIKIDKNYDGFIQIEKENGVKGYIVRGHYIAR